MIVTINIDHSNLSESLNYIDDLKRVVISEISKELMKCPISEFPIDFLKSESRLEAKMNLSRPSDNNNGGLKK